MRCDRSACEWRGVLFFFFFQMVNKVDEMKSATRDSRAVGAVRTRS
jgi:hypothetical protein